MAPAHPLASDTLAWGFLFVRRPAAPVNGVYRIAGPQLRNVLFHDKARRQANAELSHGALTERRGSSRVERLQESSRALGRALYFPHTPARKMLHCTMDTLSDSLLLGLDDLVADVSHARRREDLGRLALLCYCDLRPWARCAREERLAELTWALNTRAPPGSRALFLQRIDIVIQELEAICRRSGRTATAELLLAARRR